MMLELVPCVASCEVHHGFLVVLFLHLTVIDCAVKYPINHHFGCDALSKLSLYPLPHIWFSCPVKL